MGSKSRKMHDCVASRAGIPLITAQSRHLIGEDWSVFYSPHCEHGLLRQVLESLLDKVVNYWQHSFDAVEAGHTHLALQLVHVLSCPSRWRRNSLVCLPAYRTVSFLLLCTPWKQFPVNVFTCHVVWCGVWPCWLECCAHTDSHAPCEPTHRTHRTALPHCACLHNQHPLPTTIPPL